MPDPVLTILAQNADSARPVPKALAHRVFLSFDHAEAEMAANLFILVEASELPAVADIVRDANRRHALRALFVRQDDNCEWVPQLFDRANLRTLRNAIVHSGIETPRRVLSAWASDAQHELIASAFVIGDLLITLTCALERYELRFGDIAALKQVPKSKRSDFEIDSQGSFLHWPSIDLHLTMDSIRSAVDPHWRKQREHERIQHDVRYGQAIHSLRVEKGLTQSGIRGLSERQVRRIEDGGPTTLKSLKLLAAAHRLSIDDYLDELARRIQAQKHEPSIGTTRQTSPHRG